MGLAADVRIMVPIFRVAPISRGTYFWWTVALLVVAWWIACRVGEACPVGKIGLFWGGLGASEETNLHDLSADREVEVGDRSLSCVIGRLRTSLLQEEGDT